MSIVKQRVPGLVSRQAQAELGVHYRATSNAMDIDGIYENNIQLGLTGSGHPTLYVLDFTPEYDPAPDTADSPKEVRLAEPAARPVPNAAQGERTDKCFSQKADNDCHVVVPADDTENREALVRSRWWCTAGRPPERDRDSDSDSDISVYAMAPIRRASVSDGMGMSDGMDMSDGMNMSDGMSMSDGTNTRMHDTGMGTQASTPDVHPTLALLRESVLPEARRARVAPLAQGQLEPDGGSFHQSPGAMARADGPGGDQRPGVHVALPRPARAASDRDDGASGVQDPRSARLRLQNADTTTSGTTLTTTTAPRTSMIKSLSSMSKQEMADEASSLGFDARGATQTQLKLILRDQRRKAGLARSPDLKGLSGMRKKELVDLAVIRGFTNPEEYTVDELRTILSGWDLATATATGQASTPFRLPTDADRITFGKHRGITYRQLYDNFPKYVQWVINEATDNEECQPDLVRLNSYLTAKRERETAMQDDERADEESPDEEPPPGWVVQEFIINSSDGGAPTGSMAGPIRRSKRQGRFGVPSAAANA